MTDELQQARDVPVEHPMGRPLYSDGPIIHAIDHALKRLQTHLTYWGLLALTGLVIMAIAVSIIAASALHTSNFVQQQRRTSIIQNCQAQNQRHDHTINELNRLATANIKQHPKQAQTIKLSTSRTILLIDALQPKQNCQDLAQQQAGSHPITLNTTTKNTVKN